MCRLIGWAMAQPSTLLELVGSESLKALRQVSSFHPDGWGAAYVLDEDGTETSRLDVYRSTACAGSDDEFLSVATTVAARAGLVHLRRATDGFAVREENTHPFVVGGWAFAHNGGIPVSERIDELTSARWRGLRRGATDSERYFLALLERVESCGDLLEGIRSTVADVREVCGSASMNAVLVGPGAMAVIHASRDASPPLSELLETAGGSAARLPRGHCDRYYDLVYRPLGTGVVVSSTGMPDDTWHALPHESVLIANLARATIDVHPLVGDLAQSAAD
jgi:predicted glutamine amidotransferase